MRRILSWLVALAWVAGALSGPFAPAVAADASVGVDSLPVIAQGILTASQQSVAWRVEEVDVPTGGVTDDAPAGFVVSTGEPLVLRTGSAPAQALQAGQATFSEGGKQTRYAWPNATTMWEISLLPAGEAAQPGHGVVVATGTPFRAPEAEAYDAELLSGTLRTNATATLAAGIAPTLVIATNGSVRVEPAGGNSVTLERGQAISVPGRAVLRGASGTDASLIAARLTDVAMALPAIGGETLPAPTAAPPPAVATSTAAPAPAAATLSVRLWTCPVGAQAGDVSTACRTPGTDIGFSLSGVVTAEGRTNGEGMLTFTNAPPGTYDLSALVPGDFAGSYAGCVNGSGAQVADAGSDRNTFRVRLDAGTTVTCDWYIVPDDARGETGDGSISLTVTRCPVGYDGVQLDDDCSEPVEGLYLSLAGATPENGSTVNGTIDFSGLAADTYQLTASIDDPNRALLVDCRDGDGAELATPVDRAAARIVLAQDAAISCRATAMDLALWQVFSAAPSAAGALTIPVMLCPAQLDRRAPDFSACDEQAAGVGLALFQNGQSVPRDMTGSEWSRWSNLRAGEYELAGDGLPAGYTLYSFAGSGCCGPNGGIPFRYEPGAAGEIVPLYLAPAPPPSADEDGDGLDAAQEAAAGTDPLLPDTDFDGRGDGDELQAGTDPANGLSNQFSVAGTRDSDGDGLADLREAQLMTSIGNPDSDGDGVNDLDELRNGTDPLAPDR